MSQIANLGFYYAALNIFNEIRTNGAFRYITLDIFYSIYFIMVNIYFSYVTYYTSIER